MPASFLCVPTPQQARARFRAEARATSAEVVHASELPARHHPAANQSRLLVQVGGQCSVEVVHPS
jgi:hypothetical protein